MSSGCLSKDTKTGVLQKCMSDMFLPQCDLACAYLFQAEGDDGIFLQGSWAAQTAQTATGPPDYTDADEQANLKILVHSSGLPSSVFSQHVIDEDCPEAMMEECVAVVLRQRLPWIAGVCEWADNLSDAVQQCSKACIVGKQQRHDYRLLCSLSLAARGLELQEAGCQTAHLCIDGLGTLDAGGGHLEEDAPSDSCNPLAVSKNFVPVIAAAIAYHLLF